MSAAEALAAALCDDPPTPLPDVLPCPPLELLVALHRRVLEEMRDDFVRAARAAAAAALVASRFPNDPLLAAQVHWSQGSAVLFVPDYAQALAHYDAALAAYAKAEQAAAPSTPAIDVRVVQINRVLCLSELSRYAEAQAAEQAARAWLGTHPAQYPLLVLTTNSAGLAGEIGDYERMIVLADKAISLAHAIEQPAEEAFAWINRGYACTFLGRFEEAETALERGMALAHAEEEWLTEARGLINRAVLRRCQGQLFAALDDLHAARPRLLQAKGEVATVALEEAAIYAQLRQFPEAQRAARLAAEQFAQQQMPSYSVRAALYGVQLAVQQGQLRSAQAALGLAQVQSQKAQLPALDDEVALGEGLLVTARAARGERQPRAALADIRKRVGAATSRLAQRGLVEERVEGELLEAALDTLCGKGQAAQRRYRQLAQHASSLVRLRALSALAALLPPDEALPNWLEAAALSVQQRRMLPMEELQATYSGESTQHLQLAACYDALGLPEHALTSIWEAKAGPLLDLRVSASPDMARKSLAQFEAMKQEIARLRALEDEHRRGARRAFDDEQADAVAYHARCADEAAATRSEREQHFADELRTSGGRHGRGNVPSLAAAQQALAPAMVLLEFACWDDTLVGVLVRADTAPTVRVLGSYKRIAPLLDQWNLVRQQLSERTSATARTHMRRALTPLAEILIAPWAAELETASELLIAPWGSLYHIPWAALPFDEDMLGARIPLTTTPSGALWASGSRSDAADAVGPALLLGYEGGEERKLTSVAGELAAIAHHLPGADVRFNATAADLRVAPPPTILHIAAHGQTNTAVPLCSTIEFADGDVSLLEMHRLDLHGTKLVVLSACETSARPSRGDMALALAGAFLGAGADAVLASLWPVNDKATALLMEHFYAALAAGHCPAAALRVAQRQVQGDIQLDWAAFQVLASAPPRTN